MARSAAVKAPRIPARTADLADRNEMVERYMPLARRLAHRYKCGREPMADVEQVAYMALVKAVDGYEPARGKAFTSYAVPCILGAIKRHFRDCGWALHVPRAAKELACDIEKLSDEHMSATGRAPSAAELAEQTGASIEAVLDARFASMANDSAARGTPCADDEPCSTFEALGSDDPRLALVLDRDAIESALAMLPARHRLVLHLRFRRGLSQSEIGQCLGYSQAHVSRLLRDGLTQLRSMLDQPDGLLHRRR
jgi:RNA polymerase sigma-B factor